MVANFKYFIGSPLLFVNIMGLIDQTQIAEPLGLFPPARQSSTPEKPIEIERPGVLIRRGEAAGKS
jgi:hypothetical protein